jgi:hypothetical protein
MQTDIHWMPKRIPKGTKKFVYSHIRIFVATARPSSYDGNYFSRHRPRPTLFRYMVSGGVLRTGHHVPCHAREHWPSHQDHRKRTDGKGQSATDSSTSPAHSTRLPAPKRSSHAWDRYELPTIALAAVLYAAWAALVWWHSSIPGPLLFLAGGYVAQLHFPCSTNRFTPCGTCRSGCVLP